MCGRRQRGAGPDDRMGPFPQGNSVWGVLWAMPYTSLLGVLAVLALVGANAVFVAAEVALVKFRTTRVEHLAAEGNGIAKLLRQDNAPLDTSVAAAQLCITLARLQLA